MTLRLAVSRLRRVLAQTRMVWHSEHIEASDTGRNGFFITFIPFIPAKKKNVGLNPLNPREPRNARSARHTGENACVTR
jgi:hypothetical protein